MCLTRVLETPYSLSMRQSPLDESGREPAMVADQGYGAKALADMKVGFRGGNEIGHLFCVPPREVMSNPYQWS